MPKISIVLPTYNGEKYIAKTIESIKNQTLKDWELIIVDDASEDNTSFIVNEFVTFDNRIRIIHNKVNCKLPKTLNIGFKKAQGKYLTWISDDNLYCENALEIMKNELEQSSGINMVCARMMSIDAQGKKIGLQNKNKFEDVFFNNIIGACFMYRKCVLEDIGEYDTDLFLVEDYDYWLRIIEHYGNIKQISEVLYYYRRHDNSLSQTKKEIIRFQLKKLKEKHIDILLDKFKNNPSFASNIYFDYLEYSGKTCDKGKQIFQIVPQLNNIGKDMKYKNIIIFGAGDVGSQAVKLLKDKVKAFVDNDISKIGTYKDGFPIISFKELLEFNDIEVMVAVSKEYIYEILMQLDFGKIKKYDIFQIWLNRLE